MALILSVTVAKVCPGPMTGIGSGRCTTGSWAPSLSMVVRPSPAHLAGGFARRVRAAKLRVRVPQGRQVRRPRPGVQFRQQPVIQRPRLVARHLALAVVEV